MKTLAILMVLIAPLFACTSMRISESQSTEVTVSNLAVGDTIQVVTADGSKSTFVIEAIEDDFLVGTDTRVRTEDIRIVSVEHFDSGKTAVAGFMTFGVITAIGVVAAALVLAP